MVQIIERHQKKFLICHWSTNTKNIQRYKKYDEYSNSITVNLEPLVKRDIDAGNSKGQYSFYQVKPL